MAKTPERMPQTPIPVVNPKELDGTLGIHEKDMSCVLCGERPRRHKTDATLCEPCAIKAKKHIEEALEIHRAKKAKEENQDAK